MARARVRRDGVREEWDGPPYSGGAMAARSGQPPRLHVPVETVGRDRRHGGSIPATTRGWEFTTFHLRPAADERGCKISQRICRLDVEFKETDEALTQLWFSDSRAGGDA